MSERDFFVKAHLREQSLDDSFDLLGVRLGNDSKERNHERNHTIILTREWLGIIMMGAIITQIRQPAPGGWTAAAVHLALVIVIGVARWPVRLRPGATRASTTWHRPAIAAAGLSRHTRSGDGGRRLDRKPR